MAKSPFAANQRHRQLSEIVSVKIIPARMTSALQRLLLMAIFFVITIFLLSGCVPQRAPLQDINVRLSADGSSRDIRIATGSSVANILERGGITLGALDRVIPPLYSLVADGSLVRVIRVQERFEVEEVTVAYERQTVRNDALPAGEKRLIQAGKNGRQEITYRILSEDGELVSRTAIKIAQLDEALPEIWMVGVNSILRSTAISGTLCFIDAGNAWQFSATSSHRFPVIINGSLDSRIFRISPDGKRLLFSMKSATGINSLYVTDIKENAKASSLNTGSVTLFADWSPSELNLIAYSSVIPIAMAPGWQAQNDLRLIQLDPSGKAPAETILRPANAEGVYAWWGTGFAWSPDGSRIAYARADQLGWIERSTGNQHRLLTLTPYQARSDWVWLPPLAWSPDGNFLLSIVHGPPLALELPEASPLFDLMALPVNGGSSIRLLSRAGMFAYPTIGPKRKDGGYNVAFLQALRPLESDQSLARLMVMDRDGSNLRTLFPPEGEPGLSSQQVVWSPDGAFLAFLYQGNLWLVDAATGANQPLTSDGQVTRFDWK
jgi:resuscitation-promoting factor RpfB